MNKNFSFTNLHWLWLSLFIIALDQSSKHLLLNHFMPQEMVSITSFFNVGLWFNTGAAFSFLYDAGGWQRWFFAVIAIVVSLIVLNWLMRSTDKINSFAFAYILGGALGNLWDRLQYGYVIDFLDFHINNWHWPAFNIADAAICIGAVLLALRLLFPATQHEQ